MNTDSSNTLFYALNIQKQFQYLISKDFKIQVLAIQQVFDIGDR